MTIATEMAHSAFLVRERLRVPPNAKKDAGINLAKPRGVQGEEYWHGRYEDLLRGKQRLEDRLEKKIKTLEQKLVSLNEFNDLKEDLLLTPNPEREGRRPTTFIGHIKETVAADFSTTVTAIDGFRRDKFKCVIPRHVAAFLCKTLTYRSLPDIGRRLGGKDHTTILHAVRKIEQRMFDDAEFCQRVVYLQSRLEFDLAKWQAGKD